MELVDIEKLRLSTYNPRKIDPDRLKQVELSLRKLGFLLPVYADPDGEVISGHQRITAARALGALMVPVEYIGKYDLNQRKAINILFNRATNDFHRSDTPREATKKLFEAPLEVWADALPDIPVNEEAFYPCMRSVEIETKKLIDANRGAWNMYSRNVALSLAAKKIIMPVIIDEEYRVVNGIGRLEMCAEKKIPTVPCVMLDKQRSEFARVMMNYLSMDFAIESKYEDLLRYNSFRRAHTNRAGLGLGFYVAAFGAVPSKVFALDNRRVLQRWKSYYGSKVLDFGAGRLTDTEFLRAAGIEATPFEPYRLMPQSNEIDKDESLKLSREFLFKVQAGYRWDSIFISSVLNSVPFYEDRKSIIRIVAALCTEDTRVTVWTMSLNAHTYQNIFTNNLNLKDARNIQFRLEYEQGIIIGDFGSKPKVQKFHSPQELRELCLSSFSELSMKTVTDCILVECRQPKPGADELRKAIEFEFNLPYPDGSRMDMAEEAKAAFSARLGVRL